ARPSSDRLQPSPESAAARRSAASDACSSSMEPMRQLIPRRGAEKCSERRGDGLGSRCRAVMPQLLQGLQAGTRAVGIFAGRIARDDELIGLCRVDEQAFTLQTLATQQGNLRLQV